MQRKLIEGGLGLKTIGLIGGMSYESTIEYYRLINELVNEKLGGFNSAKIILSSVNFEEIERLQQNAEWSKSGKILSELAVNLEKAGADFIVLCTNTMHKVAPDIEEQLTIPFLHIADATGEEIIKRDFKRIGLLGTKYTMEQDFYKGRLKEKYALDVIVPEQAEIELVNKIIFEELVFGEIKSESKDNYLKIMNNLIEKGAEGIILGCTEIGLLIKQQDTSIPLFDTTYIHAKKAVENSFI